MRSNSYLSSLTSLRGIAALLVVFLHIDGIGFQLAPHDSLFFVRKGYLWVDFFFMLSGFIMVHVYGNSFSDHFSWPAFARFLWARFARIYPLHLFSLGCMIGFYGWYRTSHVPTEFDRVLFDSQTLPSQVALLQGMGVNRFLSWNAPAWSISTEWWVYLCFPILAGSFRKMTDWKRVGLLLFILGGYLLIIYYLRPLSTALSPYPDPPKRYSLDVTYDYGFFRCLVGFVFGMLLYDLYKRKWGYPDLNNSTLLVGVCVLLLLALSVPVSDLIPILLMGALVLLIAYNSGRANRFLQQRPLVWLGDISFSIYLMHMPLLYFLLIYTQRFPWLMRPDSLPSSWGYSLVYVILLLLVSTLTYQLVEQPSRKRLNHLIGKRIHADQPLSS